MKNLKEIKYLFAFLISLGLISCSEDFLETVPKGTLAESQLLNSEDGVEALLIAAYSALNGQYHTASNAYNSPASNWSFGDVVSDDAYKGGGGVGDQNNIHQMEIYATNANVRDIERKWAALYEGVNRANAAIRAIQSYDGYPSGVQNARLAEARVLRGHYYFDLKKVYDRVPYIDEQVTDASMVSNTALSSEELWNKIEEDFLFGSQNLPVTQEQVGRINKGGADAYLAKLYAFTQQWDKVITSADAVVNSSFGYGLLPNFADVFTPENNNSIEAVFSIQYSINDGAGRNGYNGSIGDRLISLGGPYPAYGFLRPSQNMVNAYKTDATGLPDFDNIDVTNTDFVDPRVDFTIARPTIPYLDLKVEYDASWAREAEVYGPYGPKKRVVSWNSDLMLNSWPYTHAMNLIVIRFSDVLLWKAEALVELDRLEEAQDIVNQIRRRVQNGNKIMSLDGTSMAANYKIAEYTTDWTNQDEARNAVRTERRLELAFEGHRFFDLVRWGVAEQVLNDYLVVEKTKRAHLAGAQFTANKNEYYPIPQSQIDLSNGMYQQNPGY